MFPEAGVEDASPLRRADAGDGEQVGRRRRRHGASVLLALFLVLGVAAFATAAAQDASAASAVTPTVMMRQPDGRVTVRATRIETPPRIDGVLDEAIYRTLPAITDFLQQ